MDRCRSTAAADIAGPVLAPCNTRNYFRLQEKAESNQRRIGAHLFVTQGGIDQQGASKCGCGSQYRQAM
jgi:hypothetical protein